MSFLISLNIKYFVILQIAVYNLINYEMKALKFNVLNNSLIIYIKKCFFFLRIKIQRKKQTIEQSI